MAIAAVGSNLITYAINEMHFPLSKAANIVTNFIGTVFLFSLVGGFVSDSYLGCFWTMIVFGFVELSGYVLLSAQAHLQQLRPAECSMLKMEDGCEEAGGIKAVVFFAALYLVALGNGGVKPNMITHGADQFAEDDPEQSKKLSSYFNAAYFTFSVGQVLALTLLVWIQTHYGMDIGFGVSATLMAVGLLSVSSGFLFYKNRLPQGSIFSPIAQVFVAAFCNRHQACPQQHAINVHERFRFLDRACITGGSGRKESAWRSCTASQVRRVKMLISIVPIFACTIVFNAILAQLLTLSVQQGAAMNTQLGESFRVPPASLQSIPFVMCIIIIPIYDSFFVPSARRITGLESGISPLQRIGSGLFLATFSMVSAAAVENRRRASALRTNTTAISIFWIAPQYIIFGLAEMLTAVGLVEFFYKQPMDGMRALLMGVTYCSYSFGFYLSSVMVSMVNIITAACSEHGWLSHNDLDKDRLDLFYWMLSVLSFFNFLNYLYWARWYSRSPPSSAIPQC